MVTTEQVTSLYRARLSTANAGLLLRVRALWAQQYDPGDPVGSLTRIGSVVGGWTTGAQAGAVAETLNYLQALYSAATGIPYPAVAPFVTPAGLVGSAANGSTVMSLANQAPAVFNARRGAGQNDAMAAASSLSWLNRIAASEPYRAANATTTHNAVGDERFTGRVSRITRPDACDFCVTIADRGYIPSHAGFQAHAHCRCTPSPEISSHARSRASRQRGREAAAEQQGTEAPGGPGGGGPPSTGAGGDIGGPGGSGGGGGGGGERERALLTEATAGYRRDDLPTGGLPGNTYTVPSYRELLERGQIGEDWAGFDPGERATAQRLRELGIEVVSVGGRGGVYGPSPDAAIAGAPMTLEFKRPRSFSAGAIDRALADAQSQSRRLVVDVRGAGTTRGDAVRGLRASLDRRGGGFDEVLVLGDGFGILWP